MKETLNPNTGPDDGIEPPTLRGRELRIWQGKEEPVLTVRMIRKFQKQGVVSDRQAKAMLKKLDAQEATKEVGQA